MDDVFLTHLTAWIIWAMAGIGIVGTIGALFSMGRQGSRKD